MARGKLGWWGLALGALVLAACTGDDEPTDTATAAATEMGTTAAATVTAEATPAAVSCEFADAAELAVAASTLVITPEGFGTAFHIGDGRFVSAEHVVRGYTDVRLESHLFEADGRVTGVEANADVAMIEVDPAVVAEIEALEWFDGERVRLGDSVGTAGYPVDVEGSAAVTRGTVSKIASADDGTTVVQTDAPVNPGNSGGALFDECGAVVGVVVQKWNEAGVEGVAYATEYTTAQAALAKARPPEETLAVSGVSFGDGTYVVGVDVQPGVWQNSDSSDLCYWERLSGFTEDAANGFGHVIDDVIANETSFELQTVEILASDAGFYALDCGVWVMAGEAAPELTGEPRSVFELAAGDCFSLPQADDAVLFDVLVAPCDDPHEHELYETYSAGGAADEFPGEEAMNELWQELCIGSFDAFAGIAYEDSRLDVGALVPTAESWVDGDREIACYVSDLFGDLLIGSMQGRGE
jgi:S1-C subfamily serine protease